MFSTCDECGQPHAAHRCTWCDLRLCHLCAMQCPECGADVSMDDLSLPAKEYPQCED